MPPDHRPTKETGAEDAGFLLPGSAVGEYLIESFLGRGGTGAVYAAKQPQIGARVAVKVLSAALSTDPRAVKRFIDEARVVNKIGHPSIISIFAFGQLPDGRHYFVMEYLHGETLASRLDKAVIPASEALRLLLQICEALEAAHQEKVVHRDLKPDNLWIATPRHGQSHAKILDFGIAKLLESPSNTTETGTVVGTPHFMSPEQFLGERIDHRTDIYAMGVIMYRMWSGRLPFEGSTLMAVATQQITSTPLPPSAYASVPAPLDRLIMACIDKDPARRPGSAKSLAGEIGRALGDDDDVQTASAADVNQGIRALAPTEAVTAATDTVAPTAAPPRPPLLGRRRLTAAAVTAVLLALGTTMVIKRMRPPASSADVVGTVNPGVTNGPAILTVPAPSPKKEPTVAIPDTKVAPGAMAPRASGPDARKHQMGQRSSQSKSEVRVRRLAADPAEERAVPGTLGPPASAPRPRLDQQGILQQNPFR